MSPTSALPNSMGAIQQKRSLNSQFGRTYHIGRRVGLRPAPPCASVPQQILEESLSPRSAVLTGAPTLVRLLADHVEREPGAVALRVKRLGLWQEVTWAAHGRMV